jgi:uncharacterized membrane protein
LPEAVDSNQLYGFGHGPLNGTVQIPGNQSLVFTADNLSPKSFFEVRVLYPDTSFYSLTRTDSTPLSGLLLEEQKYISKTKNKALFSLLYHIVIIVIGVGVSLLLFGRTIYWLIKWRQVGKDEPLEPVNLAGTLHEPPSTLEPALVETLTHWNYTSEGKSIVATILELARRKIITISTRKVSPVLGLFSRPPEISLSISHKDLPTHKLSHLESMVVDFIFQGVHSTVTLSDIKKFPTSRPSQTQEFWKKWKEATLEELVNQKILEKVSFETAKKMSFESIAFTVLFIILVNFGGAAFSVSRWLGVLLVVITISSAITSTVISLLKVFMQNRTTLGNTELASWLAFRKYLKDYSVTKNYPLDSVILWEKYLVYGAALGISLKALSQLPVNFSVAAASTSGLFFSSSLDSSTNSFSSSLSNLGTSFSSLSQAFGSYGAHGAGSSGGFSGGGGGGAVVQE